MTDEEATKQFEAAVTEIDAPKVFLTDYASYNEGIQFKYGHWVDLDQFSDLSEFEDYVQEHFDMINEANPDGFVEEIMLTDFENFPRAFYWEGGITQELFDYLNLNEEDTLKFKIIEEATGRDAKEIMENLDVFYFNEDDAWEVMHDLHPNLHEIGEMNLDFVTISEEDFKDSYSRVRIDGERYCADI